MLWYIKIYFTIWKGNWYGNFFHKTRAGDDPKNKPRVFFTCHPEDFEAHFDKIVSDIFKTHDCAIYYTEDMAEPIAQEELDTDLGQMMK